MRRKRDVILHGDVYACLEYLNDNSIAVAITSPPYWKQRDYKFPGQIGREKTPEEYIGKLIVIYNKLRQKLRDDGVFFLNIGDKYFNRYGKSHLLQIPYRLAYHMIKDGWYLEDIIIWYKPNHMPSPVRDRFTNTYEPVLVFAKSKKNIYKTRYPKVVRIPLQQTPWKHTAVYPEELVRKMLERVNLKENDLVLDPFAGTGTTALVVKKIRNSLYPKRIYSVMIEKGKEFVDIIMERVGIKDIIKINDIPYHWQPVKEDDLPSNIKAKPLTEDRSGEVAIFSTQEEFLSAIRGINTDKFKEFHREDALYFFGVKKWDIHSLYYIHNIFNFGYVLRNMIVVSNGTTWYPVFMFALNSTRVAYKFYLDRVRKKAKTLEIEKRWEKESFIGMRVRNISGKTPKDGQVVKILATYKDGFPKIVVVQWNGDVSIEFVIHPEEDEFIMEGVKFFCPYCKKELTEPYDPIGENICPFCGKKLWTDINNVPIAQEPKEILESVKELENHTYSVGEILSISSIQKNKTVSSSKFLSLERINWGASPGARKIMLGEYFTKMRLYRIDQPLVAQYLTLLRKFRNMSIKDIIDRLPPNYYHTAGHWFRKDFGGSIPIPEDIKLLKKLFGSEDGLLKIIERTALKFQTVKASIKGKNPGDYIENMNDEQLLNFLRSLYLPSNKYISLIQSRSKKQKVI